MRICSCGKEIDWIVTVYGGTMPIEVGSWHRDYVKGDWSMGEDGKLRPGMPMFDRAFVRPHWGGCPDADRYKQVAGELANV